MLSIVTSGLNAAQKDLSVTANNLANAGTTGFKRSEASFLDVYSSDPSADPKTQIGGGTALGEINRSTSQGPLKTTDNVTDMAITGRGFFTLARDDGSVIYTRAGNFTVNVNGAIVDSAENQLQLFQLDKTIDPATNLPTNKPLTKEKTTSAIIPAEKSPGKARINLNENVGEGTKVSLKVDGVAVSDPAPVTVTASDLLAGYVTFESPTISSKVAQKVSGSFDVANLSVPLGANNAGRTLLIKSGDAIVKRVTLTGTETSPLSVDVPKKYSSSVASLSAVYDNGDPVPAGLTSSGTPDRNTTAEYQQVFVQGLSIDTKGLVNVNYSDGSKSPIGSIAVATFPYEPGLRPVGDTNFVQSVDSGQPYMTEAGAPAAGEIRSGVLEESNVDMTAELMQMLKAQQVYNGNARMMQTAVELISRIADKL